MEFITAVARREGLLMKNRLWFLFGGHKLDLFEVSFVSGINEADGGADFKTKIFSFSLVCSNFPVDFEYDTKENAVKSRNILCGELDKIQKLMREAVQAGREEDSGLILPKGVKQ